MKHLLTQFGLSVGLASYATVGSPSADRRRRQLKHITFMLLFLLGSLNVWGAAYVRPYLDDTKGTDVNITSENHSSGSAGQFTWTATSSSQTNTQWRIAAGGTITFSANSGYQISQIVITSTDAYPGTWTANAGTVDSKTISGINAVSVTITTSTAARIQNVVVYAVTSGGSSETTD